MDLLPCVSNPALIFLTAAVVGSICAGVGILCGARNAAPGR